MQWHMLYKNRGYKKRLKNLALNNTKMKVTNSRRWSAFLLLFWCLQTMALPVSTRSLRNTAHSPRPAAQLHQGLAASSLLSTTSVHQQRTRRKVSDLDVSTGPVEYMKQLRSSLTNEDGSPTMEREDDPTSVWGLVDKG